MVSSLTKNSGRGSYARMKQHMSAHVSEAHVAMFENATAEVKDKLEIMCEQVRKTMRGRVERMFQEISRDYMTIVGSEPGKDRGMGKPEKLARKMVDDAIAQSEVTFGEVLVCNFESLGAGELGVSHGEQVDESGFGLE